MIDIKEKGKCCGCGACSIKCPQNCITMLSDIEGFEYPHINYDKCIGCNLCEKVCPILQRNNRPEWVDKTYAAYYKDDQIRSISSSGGVFYASANAILKKGGGVVGVKFDENLTAVHDIVFEKSELLKLCGSKYVQSHKGDVFSCVEQYLKKNEWILFTGTPCEIAGLKGYLQKDYEKLICIEVACHGVPSPKVLKNYVCFQENKYKNRLNDIHFRDKSSGWSKFSVNYSFDNDEKIVISMKSDMYMKAFLWNMDLRPSCYECAFKKENMSGDILIGDFWGINKIKPDINDDKGISLVVIESEKGNSFFNEIKDELIIDEVDFVQAVAENSAIIKPVSKPLARKYFIKKMPSKNIDKYIKSFNPRNLKNRIIDKIRRTLGNN